MLLALSSGVTSSAALLPRFEETLDILSNLTAELTLISQIHGKIPQSPVVNCRTLCISKINLFVVGYHDEIGVCDSLKNIQQKIKSIGIVQNKVKEK
jgi:hypothetical protein